MGRILESLESVDELEIEEELAELRAERERLNDLIRVFEGLLAAKGAAQETVPLRTGVLEVLDEAHPKPLSLDGVAQALESKGLLRGRSRKSVGAMLSQLATKKKIIRESHGQYVALAPASDDEIPF